MKTIFVTSSHNLISRNVLMTDFLDRVSRVARIILVVPDFKKDFFVREFSGENILVEGVSTQLSSRDVFFRKVILSLTNTHGLYIKNRSKLYVDKKWFSFILSVLPARILGWCKPCIGLVRLIDRVTLPKETFGELFKKYNPELVFATDIQKETDVNMLQAARARGIRTAGMVRSWDNFTSKGILRIIPNTLLVNNEIIKEEAGRLSSVPERRIRVVGIPHYDRYIHPTPDSKDAFFRKFGFDKNKKTILFAPIGDRYIRDNWLDKQVLESLSELDLNILVRLPPCDEVNFADVTEGKARVAFDETGVGFSRGGIKAREVSRADDQGLINSLTHVDVVVTGQSTIVLDASVFDRPVVIIRFDSEERTYWDSMRRYYDYEYYKPIIDSRGMRFAESKNHLIELVQMYLKNPEKDRAGRAKIVGQEVQFLDGKSTERLAESTISALQ